jgi:hypothetical protein
VLRHEELLSVNSIVNKGTIVLLTKDCCTLYDLKGKVLAKSYPKNRIYCLNTKANLSQFANIATKDKINTKDKSCTNIVKNEQVAV